MRHLIVDDRTGEIVFETEEESEAFDFLSSYPDDHPDFPHLWLKRVDKND